MIEFIEKIQEVLPYDREKYIDFLDEEFEGSSDWRGVSFQLFEKEKEIGLKKFIECYGNLFRSIILNFDRDSFWVINHDDKDLKWFPNEEDSLTSLRSLFKQHKIPNTFIGALTFMKEDLLIFSKDLLSYPFAVFQEESLLYKNLDISHSEIQLIIKISGHKCIDILSTDKEILRKIVNENNSHSFNIKRYNGTSLW